jgi:hypothetical protein
VASLGLVVGALGIGCLVQVGDGPSEPGWVEAAGRRQQDRLGLSGGVVGEVVGAVGEDAGMGRRDLAGAQGLDRSR